ncbi:uncharacterized protein B0H18DRAFT_1112587 [Fomitopsis serialis]|uniref:uncharacterized protein n=1 Tax=Fomitopsis serialis TaxID=139415 RepID=UPI002007BBF2|nr:uncharacterized protein B0H18DRAFT_1112587 [Neoantrodia serialis]KAH9938430.1 hypothetical protein B0H18DRAFT_1112587 [Neoantrodia serialis]
MRQAANILPTSLRRASGAKRCASSSSSVAKRPTTPVPKERMRALVSLYHQSSQFVTPSNLSATIDYEFVTKHAWERAMAADALKASPKIGDSRVPHATDSVEMWSGSRHEKEQKVMRALYGLEAGQRPGLEVLEDESDRVRREVIEPDAHMFKSS